MENLLQNSEIRIIFLDADLKIRKFTENISSIFNLKKNDIGRPISDITHHIVNTELLPKVESVIRDSKITQKTVQVKNKWYEMKLLPYTTQKGFIDGVVISFIDISDYYNVQNELKISEEKFKLLFEFIPIGITISDKNGNIISSNQAAEKILKLNKNEHHKRTVDGKEWTVIRRNGTIMPPEEYASVRAIRENRFIENVEMGIVDPQGNIKWIIVNATPTQIDGYDIAISYLNITELVNKENALEETSVLYKSLFQNMNNGFALHQIVLDEKSLPVDYIFLDVNSSFENITGLKKEDVVGKTVRQIMPKTEDFWIQQYGEVAATGKSITFEHESQVLNKRFRVNAYSPQKGQFATLFEEIK